MGDDKGFTLIELMVVVLIIAILIAIAIPTFLGLRSRAQDRAAQSNLRNGMTAAKAYFTDGQTFVGFDATAAAATEPSLTWAVSDAPAVKGTVEIRAAASNGVVLVTQSESNTIFCIADNAGATVRGVGDHDTVAACAGATTKW